MRGGIDSGFSAAEEYLWPPVEQPMPSPKAKIQCFDETGDNCALPDSIGPQDSDENSSRVNPALDDSLDICCEISDHLQWTPGPSGPPEFRSSMNEVSGYRPIQTSLDSALSPFPRKYLSCNPLRLRRSQFLD